MTDQTYTLTKIYTDIGMGLVRLDGKKPLGNSWQDNPITSPLESGNVGLNHSHQNTCTLDLDHVSADFALKLVGLDLDTILASAPYQIVGNPERTPKPLFRLPQGLSLTRKALSWPNPDNEAKLITIFELRAGKTQDVMPPSIHPNTKTPYTWLNGNIPQSLDDIPIIPQDLLTFWLNWADKIDLLKDNCPWVDNQEAAPNNTQNGQNKPYKGVDNQEAAPNNTQNGQNKPYKGQDIIGLYNSTYSVGDILERNNYKPVGNKWLSPNSDSGNPGVSLLPDNRVFSHHGACLLADGEAHDAFDCLAILEYNGDKKEAYQGAKVILGLNGNSNGHATMGQTAYNQAQNNLEILDTPVIDKPSNGAASPVIDKPNEAGPGNGDNELLSFSADDSGNARAFVELYGHRFAFVSAIGWLVYNGKFWDSNLSESKLRKAVINTLTKRRVLAAKYENEKVLKASVASAKNIRNCIYVLESFLAESLENYDSCKDCLNCNNGLVDLRTGELIAHSHEQKVTYCVNVDYNPNADDSYWVEWLTNTVTPQKINDDLLADNGPYTLLVNWLQLAIGYSLTGNTNEEIFFYLYGPTRSGKGVFCQTLSRILGKPLAANTSFSTFTSDRDQDKQNFDLAPLKPSRFISASESNKTSMLNAAMIKAVTGNDPIRCAFKHKAHFEYIPTFKIWLSSNHPVKTDPNDDATWGRLKVIAFPNSHLGKEDIGLKKRLLDNSEGILNWAIQGAISWYKQTANGQKALKDLPVITKITNEQRKQNDYVKLFIEDNCIIGDSYKVKGTLLVSEFRNWCKDNGYTPWGASRIHESMSRQGFIYKSVSVSGKKMKGYSGIGLISQV